MKFFFVSKINSEDRWKPVSHVTTAYSEGKVVVIDSQESKVYHFNGVGAAIWKCLQAAMPVSEVILRVASEFDVSFGKIEKDTKHFLSQLRQDDLIEQVKDAIHV